MRPSEELWAASVSLVLQLCSYGEWEVVEGEVRKWVAESVRAGLGREGEWPPGCGLSWASVGLAEGVPRFLSERRVEAWFFVRLPPCASAALGNATVLGRAALSRALLWGLAEAERTGAEVAARVARTDAAGAEGWEVAVQRWTLPLALLFMASIPMAAKLLASLERRRAVDNFWRSNERRRFANSSRIRRLTSAPQPSPPTQHLLRLSVQSFQDSPSLRPIKKPAIRLLPIEREEDPSPPSVTSQSQILFQVQEEEAGKTVESPQKRRGPRPRIPPESSQGTFRASLRWLKGRRKPTDAASPRRPKDRSPGRGLAMRGQRAHRAQQPRQGPQRSYNIHPLAALRGNNPGPSNDHLL